MIDVVTAPESFAGQKEADTPLLSVQISVDYNGKPGVLRNATFQMQRGEILGLAGQSGAGKSTIALAILRLLSGKRGTLRGHIQFQGRDLLSASEAQMRRLRGREIALVPQNPISSLNPSLTIGAQFEETWRAHRTASFRQWRLQLFNLLESVSLPAEEWFLKRYPRELSVGLAQRVLIAMAVLHGPALVIADEATSALDLITQSEILALFARLNRDRGMGLLYVSHDLLSVASLCGRVAILHAGEIVECGAKDQIFSNPQHEYTRQLINAVPKRHF